MAAVSTQSNASSEDEGIFDSFLKKAFDNKTRLEYGKQTAVTPITAVSSSSGVNKRPRKAEDAGLEDKEDRLPLTKKRSSTSKPLPDDADPQSEEDSGEEKKEMDSPPPPSSPALSDKRKSSITITARNKAAYVKSWVQEIKPVEEEPANEDGNDQEDGNLIELSSQESEVKSRRSKVKAKATPKKRAVKKTIPRTPVVKRERKKATTAKPSSKKSKQADYATVSMPSNYFFDGADEAARPEFNIFEDGETSPANKSSRLVKKPVKSILKSPVKPERTTAASEPLDSIKSSQESPPASPVKKEAKSGRVLRDRTNLSFVIEPVSAAVKRMEKEAKTPPKKVNPLSTTAAAANNHRRAKRTMRTEEDDELDKEMEALAKEYEGIKNYKLIVESDNPQHQQHHHRKRHHHK